MIRGLGCDLCAISRMEKIIADGRFLHRYFTEGERAYIAARARGAQTAAGIFAAKEALVKALGTGFAQGIMPEQIEVTHADSGQPGARLTGAAQARLEQMGGGRILLSLSHEGDTAIAFALIQ